MKEKILEMHANGKSYSEIQKALGCSKGTIAYHLGVGQKDKHNARRRDKRNTIRKFIQEYKTGKTCADCKEKYPYWILEFDHLKDKSFTIGFYQKHTATLEAVQKEIAKCDIVCANCHRNRTFQRLLKTAGDCNLAQTPNGESSQ